MEDEVFNHVGRVDGDSGGAPFSVVSLGLRSGVVIPSSVVAAVDLCVCVI